MKGAILQVYWPDSWKTLVLGPRNWRKVRDGKACGFSGLGYYYEGDKFNDYWIFNSKYSGELSVIYDDGGEGYYGNLGNIYIVEYEYYQIYFRLLCRYCKDGYKIDEPPTIAELRGL
jgi:hypothetical protein